MSKLHFCQKVHFHQMSQICDSCPLRVKLLIIGGKELNTEARDKYIPRYSAG